MSKFIMLKPFEGVAIANTVIILNIQLLDTIHIFSTYDPNKLEYVSYFSFHVHEKEKPYTVEIFWEEFDTDDAEDGDVMPPFTLQLFQSFFTEADSSQLMIFKKHTIAVMD